MLIIKLRDIGIKYTLKVEILIVIRDINIRDFYRII